MEITFHKTVFKMINKDLPTPSREEVLGFTLYSLWYRNPENEAYVVQCSHNFDMDTERNPLFGYDRKDYYFEYDYAVINGEVTYGKLFTFKKLLMKLKSWKKKFK